MRRTLFVSTAARRRPLRRAARRRAGMGAQRVRSRPGRHGQRRHPAALRGERTVGRGDDAGAALLPGGCADHARRPADRRRVDDDGRWGRHRIARDERDVVAADRLARREPVAPADDRADAADPVRLQFKALQTYSNGEIDRWIEDWPAGAPEPDHPAPVLEVVTGGPGTPPGDAPGRKRRRRRSRRPRRRRRRRRPSRRSPRRTRTTGATTAATSARSSASSSPSSRSPPSPAS